jgi:transcriptional regulator with XRE-family HTH domain
MLPSARRGRPPAQLPVAHHPVTRRLRRLVSQVHAGNLREAAIHTGVPYATLRELHRGDSLDPSLTTIARLAQAYGLSVDWFLGSEGTEDQPQVGWVGILPPDPESGADPRYARRVVIPFAAWSLVGVALRLERWLSGLTPSAGRPIVGGATESFEFRRRLTAFLLQPLLAARAAGADIPLPAEPARRGEQPLNAGERERWLAALRKLGDYWEEALRGVY